MPAPIGRHSQNLDGLVKKSNPAVVPPVSKLVAIVATRGQLPGFFGAMVDRGSLRLGRTMTGFASRFSTKIGGSDRPVAPANYQSNARKPSLALAQIALEDCPS